MQQPHYLLEQWAQRKLFQRARGEQLEYKQADAISDVWCMRLCRPTRAEWQCQCQREPWA
jgi:uncharacterized damage-inducible protein DinB